MLISSRFSALLDANVLYPAPLRDYLLRLAATGIYKPRWTETIQEEWITNLLYCRPDLSPQNLEKTKSAMNKAFPDGNIENFEELMIGLTLPDENDRHVLAAAIKGQVNVIVTNNIKDFPVDYLKKFDIELSDADHFILNLYDLDKHKAIEALDNLVKSLKNPPQTRDNVLSTLEKCGLIKSVRKFESSN